ncbi:hypothetical protein MP638_001914 [Amoeboaphelidium occidentale]|nr:hypothetical protein MP638_001914 [Amoeboaphelidium occidentale]
MLSAMSSSAVRVYPKKRKIDETRNDDAFPSLPIRTLESTRDFAVKSQKAVESIVGFPTTPQALALPLISPHQLQYRFKVQKTVVHFIMRKSYANLKEVVLELDGEENNGLYVRGPVGVGKSHSLYLLATELRMKRNEGFRVTYINDCGSWRVDIYGYILRELVTTFYDDTIQGKSIVEWCNAVRGSEREEMLEQLIDILVNYVTLAKLEWIIICDQHNALYARSVLVDKFPFNIISKLSNYSTAGVKVVISASANNEGYPTEMKGWYTYDISSHNFDDDEFKAWCDYYWLHNDVKINPKSDEAVEAFYWTGGVPYELSLLWKQPKETLQEKTALYRHERMKEMADMHAKFSDNLSELRRQNLRECITRMAFGLSPPETITGMDRQVFDIIQDDNGDALITALNPIARQALLGYHGVGLMNSLGMVAEVVFNGGYTNDTKGRIVEKYIVTSLELTRMFTFSCRKTTKNGLSQRVASKRTIEITYIVRFNGMGVPTESSFNPRVTTLFIPECSNYPGFDLFLWDSKRKVLMGFQITLQKPFSSHRKMNGAGDNGKRWKELCFGDSNHEGMELYWIVPRSCVGTNTAEVKDYVVLLDELHDTFPALRNLDLQE